MGNEQPTLMLIKLLIGLPKPLPGTFCPLGFSYPSGDFLNFLYRDACPRGCSPFRSLMTIEKKLEIPIPFVTPLLSAEVISSSLRDVVRQWRW